jgi:hypothetical protein
MRQLSAFTFGCGETGWNVRFCESADAKATALRALQFFRQVTSDQMRGKLTF